MNIDSAAARSGFDWSQKLTALYELTKPGITRLVVVTAATGFYLASNGAFDFVLFLHTLLGTAMAAGGTNALNEYVERDIDARMPRTRGRPLPSGRLTPRVAGIYATLLAAAGVAWLAIFVNAMTAVIVAATVACYVLVYTPLKRKTSLATLVGAVPGALPIVAGWTAAGRALDVIAGTLFWILFLWQIPHFLALAWIYRADYQAGGLHMLSVTDPDGRYTGIQMLLYTVALVFVSLLPTPLGLTGGAYLVGAFAIGAVFVAVALLMALRRTETGARRVFTASVIYLPVLMVMLAVDKLTG